VIKILAYMEEHNVRVTKKNYDIIKGQLKSKFDILKAETVKKMEKLGIIFYLKIECKNGLP
jgi:hypothetical protein